MLDPRGLSWHRMEQHTAAACQSSWLLRHGSVMLCVMGAYGPMGMVIVKPLLPKSVQLHLEQRPFGAKHEAWPRFHPQSFQIHKSGPQAGARRRASPVSWTQPGGDTSILPTPAPFAPGFGQQLRQLIRNLSHVDALLWHFSGCHPHWIRSQINYCSYFHFALSVSLPLSLYLSRTQRASLMLVQWLTAGMKPNIACKKGT